jgi:hypothetical protein
VYLQDSVIKISVNLILLHFLSAQFEIKTNKFWSYIVMSANITVDPTLAALQEDIAALKRDLGTLVGNLKSSASSSAHSAAEQIEAGASRLYQTASVEGTRSAKALGQQIEEQPVLALLVVLGIGYVGGRLLTR